MNGPRPCRPDELEQLVELADGIFRPDATDPGESMGVQYAHLLSAANLENLLVFSDGDRIVSHCGMVLGHMMLDGCTVGIARIGTVCTHPGYRGRGLAGRLFRACVARAFDANTALMLVSGSRGLYLRESCRHVGPLCNVDVVPPAATRTAVKVLPLSVKSLGVAMRMYDRESTRFVRHETEWRQYARTNFAENRSGTLLLISRGDQAPNAYVVVVIPDEAGAARVIEVAGDRALVADAVAPIAGQVGARKLQFCLGSHEPILAAFLREADGRAEPVPSHYTARIVNFAALIDGLRPTLQAHLGGELAGGMIASEAGDTLTLRAGRLELSTSRADMIQVLLGDPEGRATAPGWLSAALPLPMTRYGISFV